MKGLRSGLLPTKLLVLDVIGSAIFTLGLIKLTIGFDTLPVPLRFRHYEWLLVAVGVAFWMPAILYIVARIRERIERPDL